MAVETYYEGQQWRSRRQGEFVPFSVGGTKEEQVANGRQEAIRLKTEHIIKNMDGTIGYRNSYGNDPHPPKG